MEINPITQKYYDDCMAYIGRMKIRDLREARVDYEQHLQKLKIDHIQRARELDRRLGQNIDITV